MPRVATTHREHVESMLIVRLMRYARRDRRRSHKLYLCFLPARTRVQCWTFSKALTRSSNECANAWPLRPAVSAANASCQAARWAPMPDPP